MEIILKHLLVSRIEGYQNIEIAIVEAVSNAVIHGNLNLSRRCISSDITKLKSLGFEQTIPIEKIIEELCIN